MKKFFIIALSVLIILLGATAFAGYKLLFLPETTIDCGEFVIDASLKTSGQVANEIKENLGEIKYTLIESDGKENVFYFSDCGEYINEYNIKKELKSLEKSFSNREFEFNISPYIKIRPKYIEKFVYDSRIAKNGKYTKTSDACVQYNEITKKIELIPEQWANIMIWDCENLIIEEMEKLNQYIVLKDIGCYETPKVFSTDENLINLFKEYDKYNNLEISYVFGEEREILDISVFHDWLEPIYEETNNGKVFKKLNINENKVVEYTKELNTKYTTLGIARTFTTSTGETVFLENSNYGWWLDINKVKTDIQECLEDCTSKEMEPPFKQKADCFGRRDFSDTYVEISIEKQYLWMYVDGELITECSIVTGDVKNKWDTPTGVYKLTYKTRNTVLRGPGYASPVSYWMPFNGGIGMHDATWRNSFGGTIYKTNGSHGCINMPLENAKIVYNNITETTPIVVW